MSCSIKFYENPINTAIPPCPCIHRGMREQSEFRRHIEARTFLNPFFGFYRPVAVQVRAEIPVPCYHSDGELLLQCLYQPFHGVLLFRGACVLGVALDVQTALVADAYAALVVSAAVRAYSLHRTHIAYLSRTTDIKMIPASVETALTVHLDQSSRLEPLALRRSRAVYDNRINMPLHYLLPSLCL